MFTKSSFSATFRRKGASPTNHCWYQKVIAVSCGIKISAVHSLVLAQSTRVTDGQTDRQNYDSLDCTSTAASRSIYLQAQSALNVRISTLNFEKFSGDGNEPQRQFWVGAPSSTDCIQIRPIWSLCQSEASEFAAGAGPTSRTAKLQEVAAQIFNR